MKPGDLVIHPHPDYKGFGCGIVLQVKRDTYGRFGFKDEYKVFWSDGKVRRHEMGTVRRIAVG